MKALHRQFPTEICHSGVSCSLDNQYKASGVDRQWKKLDVETEIPSQFILSQNYPNPFNPTTTITYMLPTRAFVVLTVYDILGRKITTLVESVQDPGEHHINFNASTLPSGVYLYRLQAGEYVSVRKMKLQK